MTVTLGPATTDQQPEAAADPAVVRPAARPAARRRWSRRSVLVVWATATMALLATWFVAYELVLSTATEARAQEESFADLREALALGTAPLGGAVAPGTPVAVMTIPRLGVDDLVVVEGTTTGDLAVGPGHLRDTVLPGQAGVSVVMGRSLTGGAPFREVSSLAVGDEIRATTGQGAFTFRVSAVRRAGDRLPAPLASGAGRLTLVTAETSSWRSGWAPRGLVYVDATLVGTAAPSSGHPVSITSPEEPMAGDPGALFPTILWLQALVLALVAVVWATTRWGLRHAWVVGVPVVLAALWGLSSTVSQLLPNLV